MNSYFPGYLPCPQEVYLLSNFYCFFLLLIYLLLWGVSTKNWEWQKENYFFPLYYAQQQVKYMFKVATNWSSQLSIIQTSCDLLSHSLCFEVHFVFLLGSSQCAILLFTAFFFFFFFCYPIFDIGNFRTCVSKLRVWSLEEFLDLCIGTKVSLQIATTCS